jgi:hypothetical protein
MATATSDKTSYKTSDEPSDELSDITPKELYDILTTTGNYICLKMNLKESSFDNFYKKFKNHFVLGKFIGKGVYKVTFDDKKDKKKVIKIVSTKNNPTPEHVTKPILDPPKIVVTKNNNYNEHQNSHSMLFKCMQNMSSTPDNTETGNYEYFKILSEIKFMYINDDVGIKQDNIHVYANKANIAKIQQGITELQDYEQGFYKNTNFNNKEFKDKFTFVETDVSDLESIFVWREKKYINSLKDILEYLEKKKPITNKLTSSFRNKSPNKSGRNKVNSTYGSRTQSPKTVNNNNSNSNNKNEQKKDAAVDFLFSLLEKINAVREDSIDEQTGMKIINIYINKETAERKRKLLVNNLHSGNYGIFENNLNNNKTNKTNKTKKPSYKVRITNASTTYGTNISYHKIIELLRRLLPDKTILLNPPKI